MNMKSINFGGLLATYVYGFMAGGGFLTVVLIAKHFGFSGVG